MTATAIRPVLTEALASLPPGDRDVLLLVAWEELSYEEVARALGIPLGTVRSRLYRARVSSSTTRCTTRGRSIRPGSRSTGHETG